MDEVGRPLYGDVFGLDQQDNGMSTREGGGREGEREGREGSLGD